VAYLLLNTASYYGEILNADAHRPCAGHLLGFKSIGVVVTKKQDIFHKNYLYAYSFAAAKLGRGGVTKACAKHRLRMGPLDAWLHAGPVCRSRPVFQ